MPPTEPLTEPQITRYSRQILLEAVGGRGQERLLAAGALATGSGSAQAVGLAYLGAGGTSAAVRDRPMEPGEVSFLLSAADVGKPVAPALRAALLDANPDALREPAGRGRFSELPASFSGPGPWVALGWLGRRGVVLYRSDAGCEACFERTAGELTNGPAGALSVLLGALGALTFQRLVLGVGDALGGMLVEEDGTWGPAPLVPCAAHGGAP